MNTIKSSLSVQMKSYSFWVGLLLTVVAFSILVNLGLWQLSRAGEKQQMEQFLDAREQAPAIDITQLNVTENRYLTGMRVTAELRPIEGKYLLLDNQTYQGEVGYLAYQLMEFGVYRAVLVERGFIPSKGQRDNLPNVDWLNSPLISEARVYQRSSNPLSDELYIEPGVPHRIQNLNIAELEQYWQHPIEPYILQPRTSDWPYGQPWKPVPLGSAKHTGYAVQWFSMAVALVLLSGWVFIRALKQGDQDG
ncbi:cytochrome oxidase biogenesis protein Surf1 facilitates heme A insertion [Vibrio coralliilyticus]|uniref:SURF1 family protein n=1 Tax=Vibrio coralliilyticus TaxID=190893 RepID=UPI000810E961|nr:SURF1 family protein [Vibrio coralliilyticus]ANW26327.1 cytochrome oxidase biogenesis protein Surf1 facilitates heme A insertion [Vibrio coralliilyticus]